MDAKLMATCFIAVCLLNLLLETDAQKNGFRGGSKSYEVHVEASQMGTNLHYELPESKVKAASTKDWLVDNDNAEMLAMNSPILATVNVKHPKFSMKGQWPGYKTSFKVPKDVTVGSKRTDFAKRKLEKHQISGQKKHPLDADISSSGRSVKRQVRADRETAGSGLLLTELAGKFLKRKTTAVKSHPQENSGDVVNISKLLLPIAGMKNIDLKNPHISNAMKGVITHARKVVDEAKTVLNDAASFITRVRTLVKVTKDQTNINRKGAVTDVVAKGTEKTELKGLTAQPLKHLGPSSQGSTKLENGNRQNRSSKLSDPSYRLRKKKIENGGLQSTNNSPGKKDVSKRSYIDPTESSKDHEKVQDSKTRAIERRGLPDTLESILYTLNGLKNILKYH